MGNKSKADVGVAKKEEKNVVHNVTRRAGGRVSAVEVA